MKTMQFIKDYLKDGARITIAVGSNIVYEGDVRSIPRGIAYGTKVLRISGLGVNNDIIIEAVDEQTYDEMAKWYGKE